MKSIEFAARQR